MGQHKAQDCLSDDQKDAMQAFYLKKAEDPEFRKECDDERHEAFIATDANKNGFLESNEWIEFCKT
jgi:hypothetical protein